MNATIDTADGVELRDGRTYLYGIEIDPTALVSQEPVRVMTYRAAATLAHGYRHTAWLSTLRTLIDWQPDREPLVRELVKAVEIRDGNAWQHETDWCAEQAARITRRYDPDNACRSCDNAEWEWRRYRTANGTDQLYKECTRCHRYAGTNLFYAHDSVPDIDAIPFGEIDAEHTRYEVARIRGELPKRDPGEWKPWFGRHRGQTLAEIYVDAPGYVEWLATQHNDPKVRTAALKYLDAVR